MPHRPNDSTPSDATSAPRIVSTADDSILAASPEVPATSKDALRLAIKLAVDAGEYERAAGVLDVLSIGTRARTTSTT